MILQPKHATGKIREGRTMCCQHEGLPEFATETDNLFLQAVVEFFLNDGRTISNSIEVFNISRGAVCNFPKAHTFHIAKPFNLLVVQTRHDVALRREISAHADSCSANL